MSQIVRSTLWLLGVLLALWCIVAPAAWLQRGEAGLLAATVAAGLCAVPGLFALLISGVITAPSGAMFVQLICGGLRMALVMAGALLLPLVVPALKTQQYLIFISVFYLVALCVETTLLLREFLRSVQLERVQAGGRQVATGQVAAELAGTGLGRGD